MRSINFGIVFACAAAISACGVPRGDVRTGAAVRGVRDDAASSSDAEVVGKWALYELTAPGGDSAQAARARKRIDELRGTGLYANLARVVYDEAHGNLRSAAEASLSAVRAAQTSEDPNASLAAWFATSELLALRGSVADLFSRHRAEFEAIIAKPGKIGWRAESALLEWWATEVFDRAEAKSGTYDALVTSRLGCATSLRLAGPFGRGGSQERARAFGPEKPGPWPLAWKDDADRGIEPRVLSTAQHRCQVAPAEHVAEGSFYVETFFSTKIDRKLIVSVQAATRVYVDDVLVLSRDPSEWGSWQRFGAAIEVPAGRHRIVAKLVTPVSSIRLLNLDGTPAGVATDLDLAASYNLSPPSKLANPNPLEAIVSAARADDPVTALIAARAAHIESMDDVASVLLEPYVDVKNAAPIALLHAATYAATDPALPDEVRQRNSRTLRERALAADTKLWSARQFLLIEDAEKRGLTESVRPLVLLADEFPHVPEILEQLARVYGRLGWRPERIKALSDLAARFPDDVQALRLYLGALEEDGSVAEANKVAARIKKLDADSEVELDRALARQDYKAAIAELDRLGKRRPERKEIAAKLAAVLLRTGDPSAAAEQLNRALVKSPLDAAARFRLADRSYARGDTGALRKALAEALRVGASGAELRGAIDLIEGVTDLHPYRIDGRAIIREYEAWRKAGHEMEGNAARVLDYAATWIHPDGSSEMLEHEIQRIQSQEAIGKESEITPQEGLVLRLRVIKKDGSTVEPEPVAGKPTLTLPHLEVGDYIETEHITTQAGDGQKGRRYRGPHWFFREADKGYWRSEFIVVTPKDKPVEIETRGSVGEEKKRELGTFVERRWRVDLSPPAPVEPESPPQTEFLPSVRIGWGITVEDSLARLVDLAFDDTPLDPRIQKRARDIVKGAPNDPDDRARRVYRFVMENIAEGKETDGRRVVFGGAGSRPSAFQHLLRHLGIPIEHAVVKSKLSPSGIGKMSEVESFDGLLSRLETRAGPRYLLVRSKFAPFGYVPAEMRGQPAYRLVSGTPHETISTLGALDSILYEGRADMRESGGAELSMKLTFSGSRAIAWRNELDQMPEAKHVELFEREVLAAAFDGGQVKELRLVNKSAVDEPLVVTIRADIPRFAKPTAGGFSLKSVFAMSLAQLATLPSRQTPLLRRGSFRTEVKLQIVVPESLKLPSSLANGEVKNGDSSIVVHDSVYGHAIKLDRIIDLPAGRVQPGEEYTRYQQFLREADALVDREILIGK